LGPYKPVIRVKGGETYLYGRGGADDGYAIFASLLSVAALKKQGKKHPKIVILIEGSEESGSTDLPTYMERFKQRIGNVELVVCLDSAVGTYGELWVRLITNILVLVELFFFFTMLLVI